MTAPLRWLWRIVVLTKLMIVGRRQPLLRTPAVVGLQFEEVAFEATDGVTLRGWFVPPGGQGPAPAVVVVHGWLWNRLGNTAGLVPFVDRDVDFLPAARALHDAGFGVLLFDLRTHGASAARAPITYGPWEARDYAGAVGYLRTRADVDGARIGAVGCSMGANATLYGTADCQPVKAILAVQPTRLPAFNANFARQEIGPIGPLMLKPVDLLYRLLRAPVPADHDPKLPAAGLGDTVVQYVQGTGDPWGPLEEVEAMSAATPRSLGVLRYPSAGRYEGYNYVGERPQDVAAFFIANL